MKLREPRTEIPPSSYGRDMLKLFHPLMFAPILMLVTIGTFLSNEVNYFVYLIELVGVSFAVLSAYHIDEAKEKVTAPSIPRKDNFTIAFISFFIGGTIGMYFILRNPLLWIPFTIAVFGMLAYNLDIIKPRILYALVWGGTPIFGSYMLQTGELPNLTVIVFTVFGMLLATKLFWNWSLRTCGRASLCPKIPKYKGDPPRDIAMRITPCHSPNTISCYDRQQVPYEVSFTMKILQKMELIILFVLTLGVILI